MAETAPRPPNPEATPAEKKLVADNFLSAIIQKDVAEGKVQQVVTRFPPEPNGYAHIGHAVASFINFGLAHDFEGETVLRMDDTNPLTERQEYADALVNDMRWLGWQWRGEVSYASNYFDDLYAFAEALIAQGDAYVDSVTDVEMAELRGTATTPGTPSPYRERSRSENMALFRRMQGGEFADGEHVLRAKIDLANPNMKLRDPVLYRIVNAPHYRAGSRWHAYPSYDFAQALSDALDGVTHSFCTLEFVDNRAIYDWLMAKLWQGERPHQYEFGRRSLEYTVVSKRKLKELIKIGAVTGWDDPRMPTLAALRRRGVRPEAIKDFASRVGLSRTNRTIDISLLEYAIRNDLNTIAPRVMAVLEPLKVSIRNYPEGKEEMLDASYWPHDIGNEGSRELPFSKTLYIEQGDFQEVPEKGFKRLSPGATVRLRHAYTLTCDEVIKDAEGTVRELICRYNPHSLGQDTQEQVSGVIHWLAAEQAVAAEFRLYDRLFSDPNPDEGDAPFTSTLNPESLIVKRGFVEPSLLEDPKDTRYQFERQGYFFQDVSSSAENLIFNRTLTLRDTWGEAHKKPARKTREKPAAAPAETHTFEAGSSLAGAAKVRFETLQGRGVNADESAALAKDEALYSYFAAAYTLHPSLQLASWVLGEAGKARTEAGDFLVGAEQLAELVALVDRGTLSTRLAKDVFDKMLLEGKRAGEIVAQEGLEQLSDSALLTAIIQSLMAQNPDKVAAYRAGKTGLLGFFVGQLMKETKGKANPQLAKQLVQEALGA